MSGYYQKIGSTYYDLDTIFLPFTSGTKSTTNFKKADGVDLGSVFQPYSNQPTNLTVNYGFKDVFQSKYFTPTASCSITSDTSSATISITSAAFNSLAITGSGTATITGVSGTSSYSQSFTGLNPDSNYSYTCTPSNTGTSPASTTAVTGTASTVTTNTLPIIKGVTAEPASANWITVSWAAAGQIDCNYSYVTVGRATSGGGAITLLTLDSVTNKVSVTDTISAGTTYYYTVTPYNKSNIAGTAVTVSATSFLNTTIDTFTFRSIVGTSETTGWIGFNVKISNFTYAILTTDAANPKNNSAIIIPDPENPLNINTQVPIQFNTALSLTFSLLVFNSGDEKKYNGSLTPLKSVITYTLQTVTAPNPLGDSVNTFGFFYWMKVIVVGSGGGGGGASDQNGGGNGGGGGSGGYTSYSQSISSNQQLACRGCNINVGVAQAGGPASGDGGRGSSGTNGNTSINIIIGTSEYIFTAYCGHGGAGGGSGGNSGYYGQKENNFVFGQAGSVSATGPAGNIVVSNYGSNASSGQQAGTLGLSNNAGDGGGGGGYKNNGTGGNAGLCSFALYYI